MSFTGNSSFGQSCGAPAYGFQSAQLNQNGAGIGPNGHGAANNKGGRKKVRTARFHLVFNILFNILFRQRLTSYIG